MYIVLHSITNVDTDVFVLGYTQQKAHYCIIQVLPFKQFFLKTTLSH